MRIVCMLQLSATDQSQVLGLHCPLHCGYQQLVTSTADGQFRWNG